MINESNRASLPAQMQQLMAAEQRVILDALAQMGGNCQRVANHLGISARTLHYKLARMRDDGIEVPHAAAHLAPSRRASRAACAEVNMINESNRVSLLTQIQQMMAAEQRVILDALAQMGGNCQRVANHLGISLRTLRYKLARMRDGGIEVAHAATHLAPSRRADRAACEQSDTINESNRASLLAQMMAAEQRVILDALAQMGGNRQRVANHLGISPRTLRYKLARMRDGGIEVPHARRI